MNQVDGADGLTFEKLVEVIEKLTYVYYLSNPYIPKQVKNKEGILEDSVLAFDCYGYKVWLIHPDWLEQFKEAAIESGKKLVDFNTIQDRVMREGIEAKLRVNPFVLGDNVQAIEKWQRGER